MYPQQTVPPRNRRFVRLLAAVVTLFVVTNCAIPASLSGDDSLQQTSIALSVQGTSIAQGEATLQAMKTIAASAPTNTPKAEVDLQATLNVQMTTIAQQQATPTAPAPSETPVSESPTQAPTKLDDFVLQEWDMINLLPSKDCNNKEDLPCWVGSGYEIVLESKEPFLIDSAWEHPYLVFSQSYNLQADGYIYVNAGGSWEVLRSYPKGDQRWTDATLNLSKYKGKEIRIKFHVSGPTVKSADIWWKPDKPADPSRWNLLNIRVVPNFSS